MGTLYQIRNLINRRNVVTTPKDRVNACEEFFLLVVEAYILSVAMEEFGMSSLEDEPCGSLFSQGNMGPSRRRDVLLSNVKKITDKFVNLSYPAPNDCEDDNVIAYTKEVMSLGILLMEFNDAVKEGDGERILQCWKFFLPIFKVSHRTNYSLGALRLLVQYYFLFTPRMQQQLLWSRTINVHGKPGRNISCDLHLEHINCTCKTCIGVLGSSISDNTVQRIGRSVVELTKVTKNFDGENSVRAETGHHSKRSTEKDLKTILKVLRELPASKRIAGRKHEHFPNIQPNMTRSLKYITFKQWMSEHVQKLVS